MQGALHAAGERVGVKAATRGELVALIKIAAPVSLTYLLGFGLQFVTMLVVGHVGAEALAAAALGNMYANACGMSVLIGTASACDTLQSQAYGAGNLKRIGVISQRGIVVLLLLCIPIAALWFAAPLVLGSLGQDADTVRLSGIYVKMLVAGLPAAAIYEVLKKHLQCVGLMVPPMVISVVAILVNAFLGYALVYHTDLSFLGAPLSIAVTQWCMLLCMLAYFKYHRGANAWLRWLRLLPAKGLPMPPVEADPGTSSRAHETLGTGSLVHDVLSNGGAVVDDSTINSVDEQDACSADSSAASTHAAAAAASPVASCVVSAVPAEPGINANSITIVTVTKAYRTDVDELLDSTWSGFSRADAFSGWGEFIKLGIPSAAMLFVEWGSFEAAAIISGLISTTTLAAHTIIATTAGVSFMPILGISVAAGIRVGQCMGDRRPHDASLTYRAVILLALLYVLANACFIAAVKNVWGELFTDDVDVLELLSQWLVLLALYTFFDAFQCVASGVMRGVGRPSLAAWANVAAYAVIGLPLSYVLAIVKGYGLPGVWAGFILAVLAAYIFMAIALHCIDWDKESRIAFTRATQGMTAAPTTEAEQADKPAARAASALSSTAVSSEQVASTEDDFQRSFRVEVDNLSPSGRSGDARA